MTFRIGDEVWLARWTNTERTVCCPDCLGKRALTVILGDDSRVSIDCAGCSSGMSDPRGMVKRNEYQALVEPTVVRKIEEELIDGRPVTLYNNMSRWGDSAICATKEEAQVQAEIIRAKKQAEDAERLLHMKAQQNKTWAWHVSYHRRCAEQAERDLAMHRAKLDAAKIHAKEEEERASRRDERRAKSAHAEG